MSTVTSSYWRAETLKPLTGEVNNRLVAVSWSVGKPQSSSSHGWVSHSAQHRLKLCCNSTPSWRQRPPAARLFLCSLVCGCAGESAAALKTAAAVLQCGPQRLARHRHLFVTPFEVLVCIFCGMAGCTVTPKGGRRHQGMLLPWERARATTMCKWVVHVKVNVSVRAWARSFPPLRLIVAGRPCHSLPP